MFTMLHRFASTLTALLFIVALAAPQFASAQDDAKRAQDIRQMLVERDRDVKAILGDRKTFTAEQYDQLEEQITGVIDFRAMAQIVLGEHWKKLTAPQRQRFVDVFADYVQLNSLADLQIYRAKVTYDEIEVDGSDAFVRTTTVYKDVPTQVDYILGYSKEHGWQIHDIILDEVSTAEGYHDTFGPVLKRQDGFDRLVKVLQKRVDEAEAKRTS